MADGYRFRVLDDADRWEQSRHSRDGAAPAVRECPRYDGYAIDWCWPGRDADAGSVARAPCGRSPETPQLPPWVIGSGQCRRGLAAPRNAPHGRRVSARHSTGQPKSRYLALPSS
jgi:hypothetical protein